ncbi:pancreatic triacylglycerol lipase-like [Hyposmocoma kahamanoa]|uniref:pancreatic triacylglycerol lipase-like n=1 Tax=Hyposmocoma kahamanoa TaxID=1477025 RepID=UPI000E6D8D3B|nr:pancreatic triacylglycerol lipase-like [Hyposmocoma kahamanoa]
MYVLAKCILLVYAAVAASGFELGPQDVVFHLFTRQNPNQSEPLLPTVNSISLANFLSLDKCTVFTIHGHNDSAGGNFNAFAIRAHLLSQDVNILAVDWSPGASMYTQGLVNARQVGQVIASFITILLDTFRYDPECIRIVGVGLGGHIAGIAARSVAVDIPQIIAIDPAFHGWTHNPDILAPTDAKVVEVLHATAGSFGYDYPLGDLDFYPNGGSQQSGCAFYAESLEAEVNDGNKFVGTACETYEEAIELQCFGDRNATFGGTDVKTTESGIYIFLTNLVPPFARG